MPASRRRLQPVTLVWIEAHTSVVNQKYLLQEKQDFKLTWAAFVIIVNSRPALLQRASFGATSVGVVHMSLCALQKPPPLAGDFYLWMLLWTLLWSPWHLQGLGMALLVVQRGFVSQQAYKQSWRHESKARTTDWAWVPLPSSHPWFHKACFKFAECPDLSSPPPSGDWFRCYSNTVNPVS